MSEKLYIYGAGGHAKVVAATARLCGYEVAGVWEDSRVNIGKDFCGAKIIAFDDIPAGSAVFVAFGNNKIRLEKGLQLKKRFEIPTIIHPAAQLASGTKVGNGSYIGALANIDPDCVIGNFCIINNGANISHDAVLHDGCHICGGVQIAGHGSVGICSMMGIGSCMIEEKSVGDHVIIGAGSTVICNIPAYATAVGCPAQVIKSE